MITDTKPQPVSADYVGVVSFRAECEHDLEVLNGVLTQMPPGSFHITNADEERSDCGVEMDISGKLTIKTLHAAMRQVPDGHVMAETLRALPLKENTLKRRNAGAPPYVLMPATDLGTPLKMGL